MLGYVTKQDLDQLITSVGLPEQQLLTIFQHLDKDENGLISLDEFVQGFLQFPLEEINNNSRLDFSRSTHELMDIVPYFLSIDTR